MLPQGIEGEVSVCYSGGLDSTAVVCMALRSGAPRVHLLTLDHGHGYLFKGWAARTAAEVARIAEPGRVVHRFVDTRRLFTRLSVLPMLTDRLRHGQWFGCCLGCVMSLVSRLIVYNLKNGIPHILVGSSVGGEYSALSLPATVQRQRAFCADHGIRYSAPLLELGVTKADERALLRSMGAPTGRRFLDKHSFGNQGYCVPSLQHLPDVLFNVHPTYDPDAVRRAFDLKRPLCDAHIARELRRAGVDASRAVARVRAQSGVDSIDGGG